MAKIWRVWEGDERTRGDPDFEGSLAEVKRLFGEFKVEYIGPSEAGFKSKRGALEGFTEPVVTLIVDKEEVPNDIHYPRDQKPGSYRILVSLEQYGDILKKYQNQKNMHKRGPST